MSNLIRELTALGQSLWYDNIQRRLLNNGVMAGLISRGEIRGMTSNPSIFNQAIVNSKDYDSALAPLAWCGWDAEKIFWKLAFDDIKTALDLFTPLYQKTKGSDGFVSIEVNPFFANDTEATIKQARDLWNEINRPNLMIKIPATPQGLPAIRQAISEGINVNVTLIFSISRYQEVMSAYLEGLKDRLKDGKPVGQIASVASFFVSRVDTKIDPLLHENSYLRGKAAIANSKLAYLAFKEVFFSDEFEIMKSAGCQIQRPLWASTSTKNPYYADTIYVDELIGENTVNTVPPATLDAYRDHGKANLTINRDLDQAQAIFPSLKSEGIFIEQITQELEIEGVKAFQVAFEGLISGIEKRRIEALQQFGTLQPHYQKRIYKIIKNQVIQRIFNMDPTLWTSDPAQLDGIRDRLGWLSLPNQPLTELDKIQSFFTVLKNEGFSHYILIGMGGSSLSSEVLSLIFPEDAEKLIILDTTAPDEIRAITQTFPIEKSIFIISSKSGGTVEVNSLFELFWEKINNSGNQFIAITDPGTTLEKLALEKHFRKIFLADPKVGGRFSALSPFGMVPASILGLELKKFIKNSKLMMELCSPVNAIEDNPGIVLGTLIGQAAESGKDKLTIITDRELSSFGTWLEQLIAESSGKQGKGIIPIIDEPLMDANKYGWDRFFVYLRKTGSHDIFMKNLQELGHPVFSLEMEDNYEIGSEFYRWEMATAIACHILGVNAFDQPDVQGSKDITREKIALFLENKPMEKGQPVWRGDDCMIYSNVPLSGENINSIVNNFLGEKYQDGYIAINAFLPQFQEVTDTFQLLRKSILEKTSCATTLGYGPRYLHSTGQLHKGGKNSGIFLMITSEPDQDIKIPGNQLTFGVLNLAQAVGDYEALLTKGRKVLRLHLSKNPLATIRNLTKSLADS